MEAALTRPLHYSQRQPRNLQPGRPTHPGTRTKVQRISAYEDGMGRYRPVSICLGSVEDPSTEAELASSVVIQDSARCAATL